LTARGAHVHLGRLQEAEQDGAIGGGEHVGREQHMGAPRRGSAANQLRERAASRLDLQAFAEHELDAGGRQTRALTQQLARSLADGILRCGDPAGGLAQGQHTFEARVAHAWPPFPPRRSPSNGKEQPRASAPGRRPRSSRPSGPMRTKSSVTTHTAESTLPKSTKRATPISPSGRRACVTGSTAETRSQGGAW